MSESVFRLPIIGTSGADRDNWFMTIIGSLRKLVDVQQTTEGTRVPSFPGLSTVQFLITYSIQKLDCGKVWPILSRKCLDRGGGEVTNQKKEFRACINIESFPLCERSELQCLDRRNKKRLQACPFSKGPLPT